MLKLTVRAIVHATARRSSKHRRRLTPCVRCVLALLVVGLVTACAPAPSGPHVTAVRRYVSGLPEALYGDTLDGIRGVATEDQLDLVRRYVAYIVSQGERMQSEVSALQIREAQQQGDTASVVTEEDWAVVYRDSKTGAVKRTEDYHLKVRYSLVLQDGSWLVSDVKELERTAR